MGCSASLSSASSLVLGHSDSPAMSVSDDSSKTSQGKEKHIEKFTILLIGAGDSGKTTIRKQLCNIYQSQYQTVEARKQFSSVVVGNLLDGTLQVLGKMEGRKDTFAEVHNEAKLGQDYISPAIARTLTSLYFDDHEFRRTLKSKGGEIQVPDCYHTFMKRMRDYPQWGGAGWVPDEDDCVRSRARTNGITKVDLFIDRRKYTIIDVGGQRAERRKWLDNNGNLGKISLVVFVSSLAEYNQSLFEERPKNRLEESLDLFTECINSDWLKNTPVVLYLNKRDVFDRKYTKDCIPLNVSGRFPDAPQGVVPTPDAITWIVSRFAKRRKNNQKISAFVLTATSPARVKTVFDHCCDLLISRDFLVQPGNSNKSATLSSHVSSTTQSQSSVQSLT